MSVISISEPIALRKKQYRFYISFVFTMLFCLFPIKEFAQFSPFVFYFLLIFYVGLRPKYHLNRLIMLSIFYLFLMLLYILLYDDFLVINSLLFFVTISSFYIFLFDFKGLMNEQILKRIFLFLSILLLLESLLGFYQAFLGFRYWGYRTAGPWGDWVAGSLGLPYSDVRAYSGSSPYFIIILTSLLFFMIGLSSRFTIKSLLVYLISILCWLIASLMHSYVFFILSVFIYFLFFSKKIVIFLFRRTVNSGRVLVHFAYKVVHTAEMGDLHLKINRRLVFQYAIIPILLFGMIFYVGPKMHPENFGRVGEVIKSITHISPDSKYRKLVLVHYMLKELPSDAWTQPIIGLGPGQFSSRAALMTSGEYLKRKLPLIPEQTTHLTKEIVLPLLRITSSSTHSPLSSWISLYSEFGSFGLLLLLIISIIFMRPFILLRSKKYPYLHIAGGILYLYLFFMGIQNAYWEYTQAMLPGLTCIMLARAILQDSQCSSCSHTDQ